MINKIFLIVLFFYCAVTIGCSWPRESFEVKRYALQCPKEQNKSAGTIIWIFGPYKVYPDLQIAVEKSGSEPYKFNNCKIFDEDNWSCTYNDGSGSLKFVNGVYFPPYEPLFKSTDVGMILVSLTKWQYRYYYWTRDIWGIIDYSDVCRKHKKYWKQFFKLQEDLEGLK